MPSSASEVPPTTAPTPQQPVGGATVDASAPTLAWSEVPTATGYRVQIARSTDFSAPLIDLPVEPDDPSITIHDGTPADGSTCYWRVRAETDAGATDWGSVAAFTGPATVASDDAPQPVQPTDGAPVDGSAAIFTWSPPPRADGYEVQVATDPDFETIAVGLSVEPTTSLTLYDALPTDGRTLYWRLRAQRRDDTFTPWSAPATLTAATDDAVRAHESRTIPDEERRAARQRTRATADSSTSTRSEPPTSQGDAEAWFHTASTSGTASLAWAGIVVVSFLATLLLVLLALP